MKTDTEIKALKNTGPGAPGPQNWQRAFDLCVRKTHANIKTLADDPKTWSNAVDGDYTKWNEGFFEIGNWTASFFTSMALLAGQQTEEEYFLQQVLRLAPTKEAEVVASLTAGEPVREVRERGDYVFVRTPRGAGLGGWGGTATKPEVSLESAKQASATPRRAKGK